MATRGQLKETAGMTVFFFVTLLVLIVVQLNYGMGAFGGPTIVAISLIPILFYLLATGQLRRFSGAGFEIALQEQAKQTISLPADERIEPEQREKVVGKGSPERLDELRRLDVDDLPTTLAFEIERRGYYERDVIREYLEILSRNPDFRYVLFTDGDERFEGYMDAGDFRAVVSRDDESAGELIEKIETGEILDWREVTTDSIPIDLSNRAALDMLDRRDKNELAVVTPDEEFVGVITQDEIMRKILAKVVREA